MTDLVHDPQAFREACEGARSAGARVGLVPTMGALHAGHLSLVDAVRERGAERVALTIFVNPLQFAPGDDLERYPRTLPDDLAACEAAGVDLVFAPLPDAMYPSGFQTHVQVEGVTAPLEGAFRPGHFRGVTTIVAKLLNLTGPCVAAFGRKDYQQWRVLSRMVRDLDLPIEMVGAAIVRESDGLALSSRNRYLTPEERVRALGLVHGLRAAWDAFSAGERELEDLVDLARAPIDSAFDRVDYVSLIEAEDLGSLEGPLDRPAVLAVAAHLGETRLIDNVVLPADPRP